MERERAIADWIFLPGEAQNFSLWNTLHDGDLEAVESNLSAKTVVLRLDVPYVREHHCLPSGTRFVIRVEGVQAVRVAGSGGFGAREESRAWAEFEEMRGLEVANAALGLGPDIQTLRVGVFIGHSRVYAEAFVRGERIRFLVGEREMTAEEFVDLGEAYWKAFGRAAL